MYVLFRELEVTWAIMEFDYSPHDRTGIKLPKASEELVETLEDNQVFTNELLFLSPLLLSHSVSFYFIIV